MKLVQMNIWICLGVVCLGFSLGMAQTRELSPVASKLNGLRSSGNFAEYDIFTQSTGPAPRDTYRAHLSTFDYLEWSSEAVLSLLTEKPELL